MIKQNVYAGDVTSEQMAKASNNKKVFNFAFQVIMPAHLIVAASRELKE